MNPAANVHNVDGLTTFQLGLQHFEEKAKDALQNIDMDLRRTQEWIEDMYATWKTEVRKAEDALTQAMIELNRKKHMKIGERAPDTSEEEKQVRKCKARLEHAEEKVEKCKHWVRAFPDAVLDYEGPARQLKTQVENVMPVMITILGNKIATLEEYQQMS